MSTLARMCFAAMRSIASLVGRRRTRTIVIMYDPNDDVSPRMKRAT